MVDFSAQRSEPTPRPRAFVLIEPRAAFAAVRAAPSWATSLLVVLMLSLAPPIAFLSVVDETAYAERKLRRSGALEKLPKEQHAQIISFTAKATKLAGPPGAVAKRAVWILLVSAIAFGLLRGKKPELQFAPVFAAVTVGAAPLLIKDLLEGGAFFVLDPLEIDEQNAVLSNPAAWLGIDSQTSVAGALLRGLDFFELWSCALMGLGANVVASTRSWLPYLASFGLHAVSMGMTAVGAAVA